MSQIRLYEIDSADIATPASGSKALFLDADDVLKSKDSAGDVRILEAVASDAAPRPVGTANPGVSGELSRRDHVHAHGNQGGGSLHAIATTTASGFMSSGDKALLGGLSGVGSAPGIALGVTTLTTSATLTSSYFLALCDASAGAMTVALPPASSGTWLLNLKKIDSTSNEVTIDADGAELIDGLTTQSILIQYESITLQSDGVSDWYII